MFSAALSRFIEPFAACIHAAVWKFTFSMWRSLVDLWFDGGANMRWNVFSSTDFDLNVPPDRKKVLFGVKQSGLPVPKERPVRLLPDFRESKKLLGSVLPALEKVPLNVLHPGPVVHLDQAAVEERSK